MMVVENKTTKVFSAGILVCASVFLSSPAFAAWNYVENIDPMTDENKSLVVIHKERNEFLLIKCDGSSDFDIYVGVGEFIGGDGRYRVTYRLDKDEPIDGGRWGLATTGTSVYAPESLETSLLESIKIRSTITFQVTDYQGSKPFSKFPLAGSSAAINQLGCI
jgi:hypothetical protein